MTQNCLFYVFFFRSTVVQISGLNERNGGKSGIKWKMQLTQSRSPCLRWHGWALTSLDWHLSLQMTWNCPYQYNWHTIDLYLCRRELKFIVSCNEERRLSLMLIFEKFWWLGAKLQGGVGGVTPKGIVRNQTHFVFEVIGWVLQSDQVSSKSER